MGKLHQIRRAYEQLPEEIKKDMAGTGSHFGYNITFDKKGNAVICESIGIFGCRHGTAMLTNKKGTFIGFNKKTVVYRNEERHQPKRTYYFAYYLLALGLRNGYVEKEFRNYTRTEKRQVTYNTYNWETTPGGWLPKDNGKKLDEKQIRKLRRVRR